MTLDRNALRSLVEALPDGVAVPVPRAWLLALLDGETPEALPAAPDAVNEPIERLLTVEEVAGRMGQTPAWVYRHAKDWPFTRHLGRRSLRFLESGLDVWLRRQRRAA